MPPSPTTADEISVRVFGVWSDACVPGNHQLSLEGNSVSISTFGPPPGTFCAQVLSVWGYTVLVGPLAAADYTATAYYHPSPPILPEVLVSATMTVSDPPSPRFIGLGPHRHWLDRRPIGVAGPSPLSCN